MLPKASSNDALQWNSLFAGSSTRATDHRCEHVNNRTGEVALSRDLRLIDVTMIGVGGIVGAGIFVLTGIAAGALYAPGFGRFATESWRLAGGKSYTLLKRRRKLGDLLIAAGDSAPARHIDQFRPGASALPQTLACFSEELVSTGLRVHAPVVCQLPLVAEVRERSSL